MFFWSEGTRKAGEKLSAYQELFRRISQSADVLVIDDARTLFFRRVSEFGSEQFSSTNPEEQAMKNVAAFQKRLQVQETRQLMQELLILFAISAEIEIAAIRVQSKNWDTVVRPMLHNFFTNPSPEQFAALCDALAGIGPSGEKITRKIIRFFESGLDEVLAVPAEDWQTFAKLYEQSHPYQALYERIVRQNLGFKAYPQADVLFLKQLAELDTVPSSSEEDDDTIRKQISEKLSGLQATIGDPRSEQAVRLRSVLGIFCRPILEEIEKFNLGRQEQELLASLVQQFTQQPDMGSFSGLRDALVGVRQKQAENTLAKIRHFLLSGVDKLLEVPTKDWDDFQRIFTRIKNPPFPWYQLSPQESLRIKIYRDFEVFLREVKTPQEFKGVIAEMVKTMDFDHSEIEDSIKRRLSAILDSDDIVDDDVYYMVVDVDEAKYKPYYHELRELIRTEGHRALLQLLEEYQEKLPKSAREIADILRDEETSYFSLTANLTFYLMTKEEYNDAGKAFIKAVEHHLMATNYIFTMLSEYIPLCTEGAFLRQADAAAAAPTQRAPAQP